MRTLFTKIFIWFCVTLFTGIFASLMLTGILVEYGLFETTRSLLSRSGLALSGVTAAEIYEQQGTPALRDYFKRIEGAGKLKLFLVDENGHDVTGEPLSEDGERLAQRAMAGNETIIQGTGKIIIRAMPVHGSKGTTYVILGEVLHSRHHPWAHASVRIAAVLLTAGILCYILARHISTPLAVLQNATRMLACGNLSVRVASALGKRKDEIGQLAEDFDRMAERLEDLIDSHRRLLRDMSHELRSPLTRLHVALELARQKSGTGATEALNRIEKESDRLNALIGQVLTLSRLEQEQEKDLAQSVELSELLGEIVADADFEAHGKNCRVKLESHDLLIVKGHPEVLRSAIENVVRNAVRYTREGSEVNVSLFSEMRGDSTVAVIRVQDQGPGVPEAELTKIFGPFYRVSEARDRRTGGVGLGLAIAARAVQVSGGSIAASKASEGGLLLEIRIPMKDTKSPTP